MIKYLTKTQVDKLFSVITDVRDRAMITMLYFYGLRRGELCNLLISDIDCENNRIHIRPLKHGIEGYHYLTDNCIQQIKEYLEIRITRNNKTPYLFVSSQRNTQLSGDAVRVIYAKYAKLAGIPPNLRNPHTLRHSLACALISSGYDLMFVKDLLRHKSIASTAIYANIMNEVKVKMQKEALEGGLYMAKM